MDSIKRWGGEFLVSPLSLENGCGEDEELVTVKKKKKSCLVRNVLQEASKL